MPEFKTMEKAIEYGKQQYLRPKYNKRVLITGEERFTVEEGY